MQLTSKKNWLLLLSGAARLLWIEIKYLLGKKCEICSQEPQGSCGLKFESQLEKVKVKESGAARHVTFIKIILNNLYDTPHQRYNPSSRAILPLLHQQDEP